MAAGDHFGVERDLPRRAVGRAGGVGGAQREAVDIGAVERRHVDRRRHIVRQHAAERSRRARRVSAGSGARSRCRSNRARASSAETTSRNCSCRAARAHRGEQFAVGCDRLAARSLMAMASPRPGARRDSLRCRPAPRIQPSARASACSGSSPTRPARPAPALRRTGTTSARPSGEAILRASSAANGWSSIMAAGEPRQHAAADGEPAGERRVDPPRQQQHRPRPTSRRRVSPGEMPMPWNATLADARERAHAGRCGPLPVPPIATTASAPSSLSAASSVRPSPTTACRSRCRSRARSRSRRRE